MNPNVRSIAEGPRKGQAKKKPDFHPVFLTTDRLLNPGVKHSPAAFAVAIAIADRMTWDAQAGAYNCFCGYADIAKRTGISREMVKRALREICDSDHPLFFRRRPGETRGHYHKCNRYTMIHAPAAFQKGQESERERKERLLFLRNQQKIIQE